MSFKDKVIYQIYPKSFYDTNQDGIGDLAGIREKLPYLADLGIDMIWLNPIYPSPQHDNGYDISNYKAIDKMFGTMEEFELLVTEAKHFGIELMLDMVLNHVSTDHEWFTRALAGERQYQEYFFLSEQPTDWQSKFGGNAWEKFGKSDLYYLHLYDKTQADLNWRNPRVREELFSVVNFWRKKGIKGFRFDVINVIGKDEVLKNNSINEGKAEYTDKPITHDYLRELNDQTFGQDNSSITVGEMSSTTIENGILYTQPERKELSMVFQFHHLKVDYENGEKWTKKTFDFEALKQILHSWQTKMSEQNGWNALFWNNHDQPRALNRFIDVENYRVQGAKMLAAAIHLNRGTPYIYMGEEIGMLDPEFSEMSEYKDIESFNAYEALLEKGMPPAEAKSIIQAKSRDNSRVPMQWNGEKNAGFTKGTPWLNVGRSYQTINVETEKKSGSILSFYKQLIALRKEKKLISEGSYHPYATSHPKVYAFLRELKDEKLLVLNNFFAEKTMVKIPREFTNGEILIDNYATQQLEEELVLEPYQVLGIYVK
ncbi:trehalose-6-phosphate hydrolase [Pilibacter termitis]|uniref:Alpha,alpha-phosphotrehalase n=1 Tax=Pilibacter termitis TaxID=263852 RepID=A0A1T4N4R2_9ENTE|nr:alpha,alpha-phosphotrehalase [Pilibacter termitis]SJZ73858.1 trehalose-6-phosphate hydrolase [Pilibacter termitis]